VTLPEGFRTGGWRANSLGACAATADGAQAGFVVHGPPGSAKDARLRVVASPEKELFIEIEDDVLVGPGAAVAGKSWVTDDHLEIWAAEDSGIGECRYDGAPTEQWALRLTDGKAFAGHGKPTWEVTSEIERRDHVVRVKLAPIAFRYLTVVYSDSDDGKKQERLIGTSAVAFGKAATLGELFTVPEARASCVLDGKGALRPKVMPAEGPGPVSRPLDWK
jgi:hypothetical protein